MLTLTAADIRWLQQQASALRDGIVAINRQLARVPGPTASDLAELPFAPLHEALHNIMHTLRTSASPDDHTRWSGDAIALSEQVAKHYEASLSYVQQLGHLRLTTQRYTDCLCQARANQNELIILLHHLIEHLDGYALWAESELRHPKGVVR